MTARTSVKLRARGGEASQVPVRVTADPGSLIGPADWVLLTTKGCAAAGARLSAADVADRLDFWTHLDAGTGTSVLEDRLAGQPTEHEEITGAVVRAADRHGVDVPLNRAVLALLTAASPAAC